MSSFIGRHIGPSTTETEEMLSIIGQKSLDAMINDVVPSSIRYSKELNLPTALTEEGTLAELESIADKNIVRRAFIGQGFYNCNTPAVIKRTILENPGWYTQYTPYQAEISQGRLEALLNFQTMVADLTGMAIANASLLDEGTAAAEAMALFFRSCDDSNKTKFFVSTGVHSHVRDVIKTRADALNISVVEGDDISKVDSSYFGVALQYPGTDGSITDLPTAVAHVKKTGCYVGVGSDLLALTTLEAPGVFGVDAVYGNSQRFGVPLGFGGPHAAFFATTDALKREMPGRLVGMSKDVSGAPALRLALQTREQHIRREKATSNICTAQVLLAVMASMYAVYHGPDGLKKIAGQVASWTGRVRELLTEYGCQIKNATYFDTLTFTPPSGVTSKELFERAKNQNMLLALWSDGALGISVDETFGDSDFKVLQSIISAGRTPTAPIKATNVIPGWATRKTAFLTAKIFNSYRSETELLRYIKRLESKDLSLTASMIPLGSCTMKLNAAFEMAAVSWPKFNGLHPAAPQDDFKGYTQLFTELESYLAEITGLSAVSLQPNAGSQGEYAGLLAIVAAHKAKGESSRKYCLIPNSAHGTNPASAALAGLSVVKIECDAAGNVDLSSLKKAIEQYGREISCLMVTYPSTHGVFEETITEIVKLVHSIGAYVYMDGANYNALVGLVRPGDIGIDVLHINLHKTFCIPHGGGGPGMGPIAVNSALAPFLPGHVWQKCGGSSATGAVSSAPWGSASILVIPWAYIRAMGAVGLRKASEMAILNANYIAAALKNEYEVLYKGNKGFVAHECILDLRWLKPKLGLEVADIAKRLMDFGFHAPTVSFPVVETLMIEPSESESKAELDRFVTAMKVIRAEIAAVEKGQYTAAESTLKNAPHTADLVCSSEWPFKYSREEAAYPVLSLRQFKFWPAVRRVDNVYGDRNLFCACS